MSLALTILADILKVLGLNRKVLSLGLGLSA